VNAPEEFATYRATIEFEIHHGRLVGTLTLGDQRSAHFDGVVELERLIASKTSPRPPLVLVSVPEGVASGAELAVLTATERQIEFAAANGVSNREIADSLYLQRQIC